MNFKTKNFIWKAQAMHYGFYDYSKVNYTINKVKVEIICPLHGSFWQTPKSHIEGFNCQKCGNAVRSVKSNANSHISKAKFTKTTTQWIEDAKKVHGNKYDYSTSIYLKALSRITITCPTHGEFEQLAGNHLDGVGCPKCRDKDCAEQFGKSQQQFIDECKIVHGDKFDCSKIEYTNLRNKITVRCKIHGNFYPKASNFLHNKTGCPKCNSSRGELFIGSTLHNLNIKLIEQWHFSKHKKLKRGTSSYLRFDFYLPEYNLCIEYDGYQHYNTVKQWGGKDTFEKVQQRDQIKNQFCLDYGIKLVRIPHWVKLTEELILQQLEENFTVKSVV